MANGPGRLDRYSDRSLTLVRIQNKETFISRYRYKYIARMSNNNDHDIPSQYLKSVYRIFTLQIVYPHSTYTKADVYHICIVYIVEKAPSA